MKEFRRGKVSARSVIAWSGVVALFLATLELAARLDDHLTFGAPFWGRYEMELLFQPTPRGFRGVPNGRCMKWALNSSGFRGPELQPFAGQTRVVTYGASETFGIYEDVGEEYPRVLERKLNAGSDEHFEVVNAGMPGMRVGSGVRLLREVGASLRPSVVIVYPTPTHYIGVTRPYCERPVPNLSTPKFASLKPRVADKLKDRLKAALPDSYLTFMRRVGIWWDSRGKTVIDRVAPVSLDAFEHDLHCAVDAIRETGAVPVVVTHANRFGVIRRADDDYWLTGWRGQYPQLRESGLIELEDRANERIRAVARGERVKLVDAAAALSGDPTAFADYSHFTNEGASKMGGLLAEGVRDALSAAPSATSDVRATVLPAR